MPKTSSSFRPPILPLAAALLALPLAARAQGASADPSKNPELRFELQYVDALNRAGFPDYAEMAIRDVEARFPGVGVLLKIKKLEQLLLLGHFEEARKIIAAEPDQESAEAWGMKLTMGDYLYAHGKYPEALGIYKGLLDRFGTTPDEKLDGLYANAIFKYAQMLLFLGKDEDALPVYEKLAKIKGLSAEEKRQFTFEYAQLLVKVAEGVGKASADTYLATAQKQINDLMWIQDLWFGRAVALMAHIRMAKGDMDGAKSLVEDYMDQLSDMDEQLRQQGEADGQDYMNLSPLAECRYLLGTMFLDKAKEDLKSAKPRSKEEDAAADLLLEAMEHFVNVYVEYPSFTWATEAMARSEECTSILEELGFEVQDSISPQQRHDVAVKQFQNAGVLYNQNQFEASMKAYLNVLGAFPDELPSALIALENVAKAAIELSEQDASGESADYYELYSGAILGHIAEHFSRFPKKGMVQGGNTLRSLSQFYAEHGKPALSREATRLYFELYPRHPQAASGVMAEAAKRYAAEPPDLDGAIEYFTIMVERYPKNPHSFRAQRFLADAYKKKGDFAMELATRSNYLVRVSQKEKPGNELVIARYSLANMLRDRAIADLREATLAQNEASRPVPGETEEEAAARAAKAKKELFAATKEVLSVVNKQIKPLVDLLSDPAKRAAYESNAKEKAFNDSVLEHCYFDRAFCLSSLHEPKAQEAEFKRQAIQSYEKILAIYAAAGDDAEKKKQAESVLPRVLLQLGTLYTTLKAENDAEQEANTQQASDYFTRLSKEFGESEEARNALFLQGKSLIDLGYTSQGIAKFKEMFSTPGGKYSATQLNTAAQELLGARAYAEAEQGFKAALAAAPADAKALRAQIDLGLVQILVARKEWKPAAEALAAFVKDNPRSSQLVLANEMLCDASVQAAATERDDKARSALYRQAVAAINALRPYKQGPAEQLDLKLRIGAVKDIQAETERKFKGEEAAAKLFSSASAHYQDLFLGRRSDIADPGYLALLEELLYRAPAALARLKTYSDGTSVFADVAEECKIYLKEYPKGKHVQEVRTLLNEANMVLRTGEAPASSFFDTLDTEEHPESEAIPDNAVLTDEEAGVPPEPDEPSPEDGTVETGAEAEGGAEAVEAGSAETAPAVEKKAPAGDKPAAPAKKKKKKVKKPVPAPKPAD